MAVSTKELWEQAGVSAKAALSGQGLAGEPHPADDDFVPPVTSVKLPSRGIAYPPESPLFCVESVDVKAVTAREENILASPALIRKGTVLTTLMRACITNRSIDPDQMLVGDRNAILTAIRISAYGPRYAARVTCPECREEAEHDFDLSRLPLKLLAEEPADGPGTNSFAFNLPHSGWPVRFRLMDAATAARLDKEIDAVRKKTGQEQSITLSLTAQLVSMKGITDPTRLVRGINNLPASDSRALRLHIDRVSPGVDMTQEYDCRSCGKASEVEIPVGTEFFWPTKV
jgi:hypothetical protein